MHTALAFRHALKDGAFILFEPTVASALAKHRQIQSTDCEAGGILLGLRRGDHIHCTDYTEPGPIDRRSRNAFYRDQRHHQDKALELWHGSGGLIDYLGEWHTHPQMHPIPSSTDLREWQVLLHRYSGPLLFAVQGTSEALWVGLGQGSVVTQLAPVASEPAKSDSI